ncbi:MAG: hypothetical protein IMF18_00705 [Proteobacteria bacterium]|nr:hypothetical protein [Pseudomonadota bacterium]
MVEIPPEVQLKATVKPGSVYYFPDDALVSQDPHYFIVINNNPITDETLLLVCSSSQIEKVKRRTRDWPETTVEIKKTEYAGFTVDSIVNCNWAFSRKTDYLVQKLTDGELRMMPEMDIVIVEKLRKAIMRSPKVEAGKKRLVSPW